DHAGQEHHRLGAHAPAVALLDAVRHHLEELRLLEHVAVDAVLGALAQRPHHGLGGGEVHVRHPEREHVLVELPPLVARGGTAVDEAIEVEARGHESPPADYTGPEAGFCPPTPEEARACRIGSTTFT